MIVVFIFLIYVLPVYCVVWLITRRFFRDRKWYEKLVLAFVIYLILGFLVLNTLFLIGVESIPRQTFTDILDHWTVLDSYVDLLFWPFLVIGGIIGGFNKDLWMGNLRFNVGKPFDIKELVALDNQRLEDTAMIKLANILPKDMRGHYLSYS